MIEGTCERLYSSEIGFLTLEEVDRPTIASLSNTYYDSLWTNIPTERDLLLLVCVSGNRMLAAFWI